MNNLQQIIRPDNRNDLLTQLRIRYVQFISIASMLISGVSAITSLAGGTSVLNSILGVALSIILLVLIQRRFLNLASLLLVTAGLVFHLISSFPLTGSLIVQTIVLISAALLVTDVRLFALINVGIFLPFAGEILNAVTDSVLGINLPWGNPVSAVMTLAFISAITRYFIASMERAVTTSVRNTILLQASAEIGQDISSLLDLRQVFSKSVDAIRDRFGYYHVQIFMVDEAGEQAELVASTGDVGQKLLAQRHKLAVGSTSVIGRATRFGEPVVGRTNQTDSIHRPNPLLPNTKAELAIPILDGDKIIGALDVQSMLVNAFQLEDIQALQTVANLLATAIRNARLFEAQNRSVQEQQRLFLDSEANLREIQRLNQQLTKAGWEDFVRQPGEHGVTLRENRIVADSTWTDALIQASESHRPIVQQANGKPAVVAVPVILRGEVIGAIEVEPSAESDQTSAVEMVEAVAQRLAISLDNARLFEEAQAATAQEQRINSIVTRYQSATSVDDLLRITLVELSQSLGAQEGAIRLGSVRGDANHD